MVRKLRVRKEKDLSKTRQVMGLVTTGKAVFVSKIEDDCAFLTHPMTGWIDLYDCRSYLQILPLQLDGTA